LKFRQIIYFQNTGFSTDFQNTGLLPASPKLAEKYRPSGSPIVGPFLVSLKKLKFFLSKKLSSAD